MPILDRRDNNRVIPITFNGRETFQDIPEQGYVLLSMVSNGEYDFLLNGKSYRKAAPFFLCLSEKDRFELLHVENYECIGLQDVCAYVGTNRTTLNQKFKEEFACTAMQYLSQYRIKMAQTALVHTNLTIDEIAACCGYQYESYFVKTYQKNTGESPTEYRKRNWQ